MITKSVLRGTLRENLRSLRPEAVTHASAAIRSQLRAWPAFRNAGVIALFYPMATEPDLLPLLAVPDKTFVFPFSHPDRRLTWHAAPDAAHWKVSRFGIREPDPGHCPEVSASRLDLILVPGLAFTSFGHRLGHGAGYYDRFLATLPPGIPAAGICFTCQLQPALPVEPHDVRLQHVIHAPCEL